MRRITTIAAILTCSFICIPTLLRAQPDEITAQAPILPLTVHFRSVPQYFVQSLENDPLFSEIEAFVDNDSGQPWYEIVLTYKATGLRVFYCNSPQWVSVLRHIGADAYVASIDFAKPDNSESRTAYRIRLHDRFNQEILWQFVTSPGVASRGEGFIPQPDAFGFLLIHARGRSAAALGTVVSIGGRKNIVHVSQTSGVNQAYYATDLTVATLTPGTLLWSVESRPAHFIEGEGWTLQSEDGRERLVSIERITGSQVLINQTEQHDGNSASVQLEVEHLDDNPVLRSVMLKIQLNTLHISFEPGLPLPTLESGDTTHTLFAIAENETVIANGQLLVSRAFGAEHLLWMFDAPPWARTHTFETGVNVIPTVSSPGESTRCLTEDCVVREPSTSLSWDRKGGR
jgi:hypothetical protein